MNPTQYDIRMKERSRFAEPVTAAECRTGFDPSKLDNLPPTISQRFVNLEKDLAYLGEKLNEMKTRLGPIMRSSCPVPCNTACESSVASNSEMFEAIERLDRTVHQHVDVINTILDQIQL